MAVLVSLDDLARGEPLNAADDEADPLLRFAGAWGAIPDEEIDQIVELIHAERARNVATPPTLLA